MKLRILMASLAFAFSFSSNVYADPVEDAFKLCSVMDGSGVLSSECKVKSKTVELSIDTTAIEAKKMCTGIVGMSAKYGLRFDSRWKIRIYSPFSGDNSLAVCTLK